MAKDYVGDEEEHGGMYRPSIGEVPGIENAAEKKLIRKLDLHIVAFFMSSYFLSFLVLSLWWQVT